MARVGSSGFVEGSGALEGLKASEGVGQELGPARLRPRSVEDPTSLGEALSPARSGDVKPRPSAGSAAYDPSSGDRLELRSPAAEPRGLAARRRSSDLAEQAELSSDAARLHRGQRSPLPPALPPADLVGLRADRAREARRIAPKAGSARGGREQEPGARALPHAGSFLESSPEARLLGRKQATLHRPWGDQGPSKGPGTVVIA